MIEAPEKTANEPRLPAPDVDERLRHRIRLVAFSLLLMVLPFVTAPGNIIADTKLDLAVNPAAYLTRALTLWDPQQFGMLQNQVAGYLFPMGPFFWLGKLAALPPWAIQRLWIGAVVVAAFLGTVRLAGRLGIGTPWTRIAAGFAYATSPAGLAIIGGGLSEEFLPAAMLPWILLPLVDAGRGGRRGIAAARSAVAVGLCGGINAAATVAVLLPPVLYILTLARPAPRWRILAWWSSLTAVATIWWTVPLLLLLRYGVSWLPYTESAAVTTTVTGLSPTLRGAEDWVSYLFVNGQPWWPLGYLLGTGAVAIVLSGVVAGLGLAGLARAGLPARRFLLFLLLAGVLIITAGHVSKLGNPSAGLVDQLINGPASPFRNVRKFDPMIRLPVALGIAYLLPAVRLPRLSAVAAAVTVVAIGGLALPAYTGGIAVPGSFNQIPQYWVSAANWLTRHAHRQAVLIEPATQFGQYLWGETLDNVLQPLTSVDWADRELSLIGSPGNERLLDAIDQQLASGVGSPGLASVLARMGVRYLVVRNDMNRTVLNGAWPALVNQALAASPGIRPVARFGMLPVGSFSPNDAIGNLDTPYPPVEIYQVAGAQPVATVEPAAGTVRVYGGPEAELTLAREGLLGSRPVLLNGDSPGLPTVASVITDSLRRRVRNFGELRRSYSPTLTARQPAKSFESTSDYLEPGWSRYLSVARYLGIRNVTASSSAADIGALPAQWASGLLPYAAVDGDPRTMWETGSWTGPASQWIRLQFNHPIDARTIWVAFADSLAIGPPVSQVTVRTAAGQVTDRVLDTGNEQPLRVPPGASGWLQLKLTGFGPQEGLGLGVQAGIKDIRVPGVQAGREIAAPSVPGTAPAAVVLAKTQPWPSGCMLTSLRWVCSPSLVTPTEEQYGFDHAFTAAAPATAVLRGSAVLTSRWLASKFMGLTPAAARVRASSTYTTDLQDSARAAFDADPATAWIASPADAHPTLTISWSRPRTLRRVTIQRPPDAGGLLQVMLAGSGGQVRGANVGPNGIVRFAPMRTSKLTFFFSPLMAPLQISGISIPGVPQLSRPSVPLRLRCGFGPSIQVDGQTVPTRAWGSFADLLAGRPLHFASCPRVQVRAGTNQVVEPGWDRYSVQDVAVEERALPVAAAVPAARAEVVTWTPSHRVLGVVAPTASYLVVNENYNAGWQAVSQGRQLRPMRLDGWKQGWLLPAGTAGPVTLTYQPDRIYRVATVGGLGALGLLIVVVAGSWVGGRRRPRPTHPAAPAGTAGRAAPSRLRRRPGGAGGALGVAVLAGTLAAGFWLGGYPGLVVLPAATGAFLVFGYWQPGWLPAAGSPLLLAGLAMAMSASSALGEHLQQAGTRAPVVPWLTSGIPQIIGLVIVSRLVAAFVVSGGPPNAASAAAGPGVRSGSSSPQQ
ncbi:MAG: alpha-(1-_3)-arabinofuranosyltransferase family protein [Gemmatimonadota bacterium]